MADQLYTTHLLAAAAKSPVFLAGGAAGDHTVTGIKAGDYLVAVNAQNMTTGANTDLLAEFAITADDTINNVGGTATTNQTLWVTWVSKSQHLTDTGVAPDDGVV